LRRRFLGLMDCGVGQCRVSLSASDRGWRKSSRQFNNPTDLVHHNGFVPAKLGLELTKEGRVPVSSKAIKATINFLTEAMVVGRGSDGDMARRLALLTAMATVTGGREAS